MIDDIRAHLDALAKPRGAMGRLEALATELALTQRRIDARTSPRRARRARATRRPRTGRRPSCWPITRCCSGRSVG